MDYYELALYNHILASVDDDTPGNTYHVPLNPGARKGFGNPNMDGFTCCNGTALESHTKLQDSIYFKSADNRALYVNLYVPIGDIALKPFFNSYDRYSVYMNIKPSAG